MLYCDVEQDTDIILEQVDGVAPERHLNAQPQLLEFPINLGCVKSQILTSSQTYVEQKFIHYRIVIIRYTILALYDLQYSFCSFCIILLSARYSQDMRTRCNITIHKNNYHSRHRLVWRKWYQIPLLRLVFNVLPLVIILPFIISHAYSAAN